MWVLLSCALPQRQLSVRLLPPPPDYWLPLSSFWQVPGPVHGTGGGDSSDDFHLLHLLTVRVLFEVPSETHADFDDNALEMCVGYCSPGSAKCRDGTGHERRQDETLCTATGVYGRFELSEEIQKRTIRKGSGGSSSNLLNGQEKR